MSTPTLAQPKTILIADDEEDILEIIEFQLIKEGYKVIKASHGEQAIELAEAFIPDLIMLDVMMPFKTGLQVCEILRANPKFNNSLIVFLTAINNEETHIKGLELGADDFISKPISPKIIATKVNTLFRRIKEQNQDLALKKIISINHIVIDGEQYVVHINKQAIILARKEFELLYLLASNTQKIFLRNEILDNVWGADVIVGDRTIDVHIRKIRQKLNIDCITTVKGVGYRFNEHF
jgi:two-component system, OmpR family, alkaline phosphatase synthesis response regulator PhoP